MSPLEQLPPDQQAVVSLLIRQGRTYSQVASLLAIDESAVRGRAQQALMALGGRVPADLQAGEPERIADYLLGQLSEAERIETLALLLDAASTRAWARKLAAELRPLATVPLPAVPAEPEQPIEAESALAQPVRAEQPRERPTAGRQGSRGRQDDRTRKPPARPRSADSQRPHTGIDRGSGVLLATAVLLVAAIVAFAARSGGSSSPPAGPIPESAATATSTSASSGTDDVVNQLTLSPTAASSDASGAVAILKTGSTLQLAFTAAKLPAPGSAHYVLWLYDSPTHFEALGEVPSVKNGSVGPLAVTLPADASSYHGVELTLETSSAPASPGPAVLRGTSSSPL